MNIEERLSNFHQQLQSGCQQSLGYPSSMDFDYEALLPFLSFCLNNVGDPFTESTYKLNSYSFEREVMEFYAQLTQAPDDQWWGYVTNGGSEGNLYGLYLARELYPDGVVYYSQDTHYSVSKNLHFLGISNIMIRSQGNGEIDYDDLRETIRIRRDAPPIIFANIGTTMTEARDDLNKIHEIMRSLAINRYYIHSDAALSGGYLAFLDQPPAWNFADGAHSVSISGHKFMGSPIPCGIVLALRNNVERIARSVAYIGSRDTTVTGSRNGFSPLILWYAIQKWGHEGLIKRMLHSLGVAAYTVEKMNAIGINAWRNKDAITVVFPELSPAIRERWQLATADGISHILCMPNIQKKQIDALLNDIQQDRQGVEQ